MQSRGGEGVWEERRSGIGTSNVLRYSINYTKCVGMRQVWWEEGFSLERERESERN